MRILFIATSIILLSQIGFSQSGKGSLDTIFCDIQNTSCIVFNEEVSLVDVGNPQQYAAQIKSNLVFIKPQQKDALPTTILIKSGITVYHGTLVYNKTGKPKPYYYEIKSGSGGEVNINSNSTTGTKLSPSKDSQKENSSIVTIAPELREKMFEFIKIKSEINSLGFISSNVDAAVTVIRNDNTNTFLKIIIKNKSSLPFKLDFISFQYYQDMKKGALRKSKKAPIDVFPVGSPTIKEIAPKSTEALPYAIPSYALANNGYLMVLVRESDGDRVLKIKIDGNLIQEASQLIIEK
jgi:hypothetical protein